MKIGIMQPYLFPYIGYWQLIYAVDKYVILDDVNYIMRGYINRNNILIDGKSYRFTIPMDRPSQNKLIMESKLKFPEAEKRQFLKTVELAYKRAPFFSAIYPLIQTIILNDTDDLTDYIVYSMRAICDYLCIKTPFCKSSEIKKDNALRAQEKILDICKELGADAYINPAGGRMLYSSDRFKQEQIQLYFLDTDMEAIKYKQLNDKDEFVSSLSIIDILMFNDIDTIRGFLKRYHLNEE